jgi:hypothetical protein
MHFEFHKDGGIVIGNCRNQRSQLPVALCAENMHDLVSQLNVSTIADCPWSTFLIESERRSDSSTMISICCVL